jgi:hypothetical protein
MSGQKNKKLVCVRFISFCHDLKLENEKRENGQLFFNFTGW